MDSEHNDIPRVLVTGSSGLIGGLVVRELGNKYRFSGLNRRPVDGIPSTQADIVDFDAIRPAFDDIDMVVHLSAETKDLTNWDKILSTSVQGTVNVFRAAADAGVRRVGRAARCAVRRPSVRSARGGPIRRGGCPVATAGP